MAQSRLVIIPLVHQYLIQTGGIVFGGTPDTTIYLDLEVAQFRALLPQAQELTLFTQGEGMTSLLTWAVFFRSAYTRSMQSPVPKLIGSSVTGTGGPNESKRHTAYSTVADFNLDSRLQIGFGNTNGSTRESGLISASLGMLLVGG